MANPQKENGHIRIATEIWEELCKIRIPGEARQCLDFILRKTYGFNKKEDRIPISQFVAGTGIIKQHIKRNLDKLLEMGLVTNNGYNYSFNKNYSQWRRVPKKVTVTNNGNAVTNNGYKKEPIKVISINNNKHSSINTILFEKFWEAYNKKTGKKKTLEYWKQKKLNESTALLIIEKAKQVALTTEVRFRKDPERWIRDERWNDEIESTKQEDFINKINRIT